MAGFSLPPFDMIWLMETISDHANKTWVKENQQRINNKIRENRLLFELGEITREEYDKRNKVLNNQRLMYKHVNGTQLSTMQLLGETTSAER
jgi:transcription elongation GreA/GreB family factor